MAHIALESLISQNDIRRLISGYCDAVSRRDADSVGVLFAADARVQIADFPERVGQVAIIDGLRRTLSSYCFLHQRCDIGLIDVDGDTARARLAVFETNRLNDADKLAMIFGIYEDNYKLIDKAWRFHRRRFTLQLRTMLPVAEIQQFTEFVPMFGMTP